MTDTQGESGGDVGAEKQADGFKGYLKKHGPEIGLAVLICYVILLGIGVAAEIFKIQWILDWWIFNPPRR